MGVEDEAKPIRKHSYEGLLSALMGEPKTIDHGDGTYTHTWDVAMGEDQTAFQAIDAQTGEVVDIAEDIINPWLYEAAAWHEMIEEFERRGELRRLMEKLVEDK